MNKLTFRRNFLSLALRWLVLGVFASLTVFPLIWMFSTALKSPADLVTRTSANPLSPWFWPSTLDVENFRQVWKSGLGRALLNSVILSASTVSGLLLTSVPAAYAFARLEFAGRKILFSGILATLMIPETVTFIPNFLTVASLHWVDTWQGLTVPFMANAFTIFFLYQYIRQIPSAFFDAAKLDGASHLSILGRIIVPLIPGPLATVIFLEMLASWNSLQWPLLLAQTETWRPVSVALARFSSEEGPLIGLRMAASVSAVLPLLLAFVLLQRRITETLVRTGIR